jgi:hypothetical protein
MLSKKSILGGVFISCQDVNAFSSLRNDSADSELWFTLSSLYQQYLELVSAVSSYLLTLTCATCYDLPALLLYICIIRCNCFLSLFTRSYVALLYSCFVMFVFDGINIRP